MDIQQPSQHQRPALSGIAWWGRIAFIAAVGMFLVAIGLQVFLAGMSIFTDATWWRVHVTMAHFIEYLPIVMIVLAFVGRLPRSFALWSLLLLGLFALQYAFVEIAASTGVHWIAAFHPVNALVMLTVSMMLFQKSRRILAASCVERAIAP